MIGWFHQNYIHHRRVDVLARHFAELIVDEARVLDVGCGDGRLAARIAELRPDLSIRGIDVLIRDQTAVPVDRFDGQTIPLDSGSFDSAILVDVLHHTESPQVLLAEAARVATTQLVIKDHFRQGIAAQSTLTLMDRIGNARHGVEIPCNYLTPQQWNELLESCRLQPTNWRTRLGLYPPPLSWLFERNLHFIATLKP